MASGRAHAATCASRGAAAARQASATAPAAPVWSSESASASGRRAEDFVAARVIATPRRSAACSAASAATSPSSTAAAASLGGSTAKPARHLPVAGESTTRMTPTTALRRGASSVATRRRSAATSGEPEADRVPAGPPEGKPEEEQAGAGLPGEPEAANGPVGDRRPGTPPGAVQDVPTVALAAEEPSGGSPALTDVPAGTATQQADQPAAHRSSLEWTLVAWPGFFPAARARVGTTFACPSCERRGLIARVVALAKWRQRHARRGVG